MFLSDKIHSRQVCRPLRRRQLRRPLLLQHSAHRTDTPFHIQRFFSDDPALAYLRGEAPFDDRSVYPWPAFMLCDYGRCRTKAHTVVSRIRGIPSCQALPIIIFSNAVGDHSVAKWYQAGADHFLDKPITTACLDIIVQTLYECVTSEPRCFDSLKRLPEYQAKLI